MRLVQHRLEEAALDRAAHRLLARLAVQAAQLGGEGRGSPAPSCRGRTAALLGQVADQALGLQRRLGHVVAADR